MAETDDTPTADDAAESTATAEPGAAEAADLPPAKLHQTVEIQDVGPCKKHIKVTVDRPDIDARLDEKYSELVTEHRSHIPGLPPGNAPTSRGAGRARRRGSWSSASTGRRSRTRSAAKS